ncbi:MAG: mechanosensitive ion channel domain-containing protein, partial [Vicinamibacteria bacterium]
NYVEASRYLAVSNEQAVRSPELARRLKAVLDRHLWIDLDRISSRSTGDQGDGLPAAMDEVGTLAGREPVRLVRREIAEGAIWVFSNTTVNRIDAWYDRLPDRWIRDRIPEALLRPGPKDLLRWQWLALLILGVAVSFAGRWLATPVILGLRRALARTATVWDDALLDRVASPLSVGLGLLVARLSVPCLGLYAPAEDFVGGLLRALGLITFFWALWRGIDLGELALNRSVWAERASSRSLVSLGGGLAKVVVTALGLVTALSELGYPVSGLVAGLGIGGVALALAAQKTVENLFGSLSLALDRPFDVGEFVKVEDFVGTVEAVGLRSTRIRTLDRTLVTIPNGRMADMRLETYSARDRMRLACIIGLVYETRASQMRQVLEGIEGVLRSHPKIWPDAVVVRFQELGTSSLNLEVMAWFQTSEWSEFQLIRQEVLLQVMDVVEGAGTGFAFPTQTLHVVGEASAVRAAGLVRAPAVESAEFGN